ncbi:hypothetical protein LTR85_005046 [Meristemomyces frigidus]|nr:hypothetical protein LTR85_005046 [Meristemomyces frigidus]
MSYQISLTAWLDPAANATLQSAAWLGAVDTYNTSAIHLYASGCKWNGQNNCSLACQQPEHVWGSLAATHNCLAYPAISGLLDTDRLSAESAELASQYGIYSNKSVALSSIVDPLVSCAVQSCMNSTRHPSYCSEIYSLSTSVDDPTSPDFVFYANLNGIDFVEDICYTSPASANLDIGGIGVYISYLIQLSVVLSAWLYNRSLSTWLRWAACSIPARKNAYERAKTLQAKIDATQQRPALIAGLVDFQKAQAYFSITLQGAALLAIWHGGAMFEPTSRAQIDVTVSLVGDVATSGIVCITFGLYMLHAARKTSPYVSTLSAIAVGMSMITWIRTRLPVHPLVNNDQSEDARLTACGGHNPAASCAPYDYDLKSDTRALEAPILSFCVFTMLLLLLCQSHTALASSLNGIQAVLPRRSTLMPTLTRQTPTPLDGLRTTATSCVRRAWATLGHGTVESIFVLMATIMMAWLVSPSSFDVDTTYQLISWRHNAQWTFGQLIAFTIWAPTIIEYLYSAVFGIEEAHEHKYPSPYKVVKDGSDSEESGEVRSLSRTNTFYRRLNSPSRSRSELELPLVHVHDDSSRRSSMQEV